MSKNSIIQNGFIDEEAAISYLNNYYKDIELLPNIPEELTIIDMAAILNVSVPTIERMIIDKQLTLTKKSVLHYIMENMLCNRPINLDKNTTTR